MANEQADPKHSKPTETTKQTMPGSPVQPGQPYETIEPKRRADEATGREEPSAHPKRAPQDEPGYEAKQKAEEAKKHPKDEHKDAANEHKPAPRSHAAHRKHEVKRSPVKVKAKVKTPRWHK